MEASTETQIPFSPKNANINKNKSFKSEEEVLMEQTQKEREDEKKEEEKKPASAENIDLHFFKSFFILSDVRTSSFVRSVAEQAMRQYGVTTKSIFEGMWAEKKMGNEYFYSKRYLWINPQDCTFHWSKTCDRSKPHKRIQISNVTMSDVALGRPRHKFFIQPKAHQGKEEITWSIYLRNDTAIDLKMDSLHIAQEWIQVFRAMIARGCDQPSENIETQTLN